MHYFLPENMYQGASQVTAQTLQSPVSDTALVSAFMLPSRQLVSPSSWRPSVPHTLGIL